jgi:integrase
MNRTSINTMTTYNTIMKKQTLFTGEKALTRAEFNKLLDAAETSEHRLMLLIGAGLGLRRFDMSRIVVRNINFEEHSLTYLEKKKGDAPHTVYIPRKLEQELQIFIHDHNKGLNDRLFSVKDRQLCRWYHYLLKKCDIEVRGIHSLRGTCVHFCQNSGWTIEQTAKLINDKVSTVQEHYSTPSQSEMKEVTMKKEVI